MANPDRHRLRLWLQSERAFGLAYVGPIHIESVAGGTVPAHPGPAALAVSDAEDEARSDLRGRNSERPPDDAAAVNPPADVSAQATANPLFGAGSGMPTSTDTIPVVEPFTAPALSGEEKRLRLAEMDTGEVRGCTRCRLCETRTRTVFGEGSADAELFFIGEGPGENEDLSGRPFVGQAGELLDKMISAMGLKREQVYIANVVKCRPPQNREPAPDEIATCTPYLTRQLEIVRPKVIVTLGRPATQHMLQSKLSMSRLRGTWQRWRGIPLMPTFHPAYVLRQYTDNSTRKLVWGDLRQVMDELERGR